MFVLRCFLNSTCRVLFIEMRRGSVPVRQHFSFTDNFLQRMPMLCNYVYMRARRAEMEQGRGVTAPHDARWFFRLKPQVCTLNGRTFIVTDDLLREIWVGIANVTACKYLRECFTIFIFSICFSCFLFKCNKVLNRVKSFRLFLIDKVRLKLQYSEVF